MCWTEHLLKAGDIRLFKSIEELKNMARNEFFRKEDPLMDEYPECFEELKKARNEFFPEGRPAHERISGMFFMRETQIMKNCWTKHSHLRKAGA